MVITNMDITKINTTKRDIKRAPIMKATRTNRKKMAIMAVITIMTVPAPAPAIMKMNTRKITKSTSITSTKGVTLISLMGWLPLLRSSLPKLMAYLTS